RRGALSQLEGEEDQLNSDRDRSDDLADCSNRFPIHSSIPSIGRMQSVCIKRLCALRIVRIEQQLHAQFGLFQRRLAFAKQRDAALERAQRFVQAQLAPFQPRDQLFQFVQRLFEARDGGRGSVVLLSGFVHAAHASAARAANQLPPDCQTSSAAMFANKASPVALTNKSPAESNSSLRKISGMR